MCQSKGQSSVAILTSGTPLCLHVNTCYIIENTEELIAPSANLKWYYYILWMFINKCMCYGLNIARNWIAWTLYSETTTFSFLLFWISGLSGGFIGEFLQFCCWWSDKDTDCICCVYCILKISAFHGYMTCSSFCFLSFCVWRLYPDTTRCPAGGTLDS